MASFGTLMGEIKGAGPNLATFSPDFLSTGGVTGGLGNNPIQTGIPTGGSSGGTTTQTTTQTSGGTGSALCPSFALWNPFCWGQVGSQAQSCVGDFLLRVGLFILGFVAIAGAIYLYKGSGSNILAIPGRVARGAVKATKTAIQAAAHGEE